MKPGWRPPYPSFVARFAPAVQRVVMAYFGVQFPAGSPPPAIVPAALAELATVCAAPGGPGQTDRAEYVDEAGYQTIITIAYWDDPARYQRWSRPARAAWLADARRATRGRYRQRAARDRRAAEPLPDPLRSGLDRYAG